MNCPFCTSENVTPKTSLHGETRFQCGTCGEAFMLDMDAEDDISECDIVGHDWQEHEMWDGYTFGQCVRCGLIDD